MCKIPTYVGGMSTYVHLQVVYLAVKTVLQSNLLTMVLSFKPSQISVYFLSHLLIINLLKLEMLRFIFCIFHCHHFCAFQTKSLSTLGFSIYSFNLFSISTLLGHLSNLELLFCTSGPSNLLTSF